MQNSIDSFFIRALDTKAINQSEYELLSKHARVVFKREGGTVTDTAASLFKSNESQMDRIKLCDGCTIEEYLKLDLHERRSFKENNYRLIG